VITQVQEAITVGKRAVIVAPPGAGKTTIIPLKLLDNPNINGQIIILEPRRLAARAAANQMAAILNERIGETVGFKIKGLTKVSKQTRIVVMTEGILIRMIQSDPSLSEVGCIIFDEFHERSINSDLGLALSLQLSEILRSDLRIVVMSATLDVGPVSDLLDTKAPIISDGRAYHVNCEYLSRPRSKNNKLWENFAQLISDAFEMTEGGILAFLPGEAEIRATEKLLKEKLPNAAIIMPLYGSLPFEQQNKILEPLKDETFRKVVLSTSIAETSLTISGIKVVVDSGYTRRSRYDPTSGMSRLITQKISKAEANQRMGRAGRVGAGWCYRNWAVSEEGGMLEFPPSEIEISDLSNFALELSLWGSKPESMKFLTKPEPNRLTKAYELLNQLGAISDQNKITPHGREIAKFPCHVRLAHMLTKAGKKSATIAALLQNRDTMFDKNNSDFQIRLNKFDDGFILAKEMRVYTQKYRQISKFLKNWCSTILLLAQLRVWLWHSLIG
jgi:ATP-dependent helicase HrpB